MRLLLLVLGSLGSLGSLGCYASHERAEDVGPDGCARPRDVVAPLTIRSSDDTCVLSGPDALGVEWTSVCDETSCTLLREGEAVCTCTSLDFANVCPGGVPTCGLWPYFDFTDSTVAP